MSVNWRRWVRYAQAKIDASVADGEAELDRREAALDARAAEQPWLASDGVAPTFDEAKARIEAEARAAGAPSAPPSSTPPPSASAPAPGRSSSSPTAPSGAPAAGAADDVAFDVAAHQAAADARLASIRAELGLGDAPPSEPPPGDAEPPAP